MERQMDILLSMGFDPATAKDALNRCSGNFEQAMEMLLGESATATTGASAAPGGGSVSPTHMARPKPEIIMSSFSQYSFSGQGGGSSACTAISCTVTASLLKALQSGEGLSDTQSILNDAILCGISSYSSSQGLDVSVGTHDAMSTAHMSVEDYMSTPGARDLPMDMVSTPLQGMLTEPYAFTETFEKVRRMVNEKGASSSMYAGIVITKPPETICVFIPLQTVGSAAAGLKYYFFDSHARPQFGLEDAYLMSTEDVNDIVERLNLIFHAIPMEEGDNLHAAMYNCFDATPFLFRGSSDTLDEGFVVVDGDELRTGEFTL